MLRFVVDESSWDLAGLRPRDFEDALEALLDRLDTASKRQEEAQLYEGFYDFDGVTPRPFRLLFEPNEIIQDCDLRLRVSRALDRLAVWTDEVALDVDMDGSTLLAPSIAFAHDKVGQGQALACLTLRTAGRSGPLDVTVDGRTQTVHFVTDEPEHRAFFRDAIEVENADDKAYPALAASAFPELRWADGLWGGLHDFSKPFRELRAEVTRHLGVLDDHGLPICREHRPQDWQAHFGSHGVTATGENGRTMRNNRARRDRTRTWDEAEHVFWWHAKIEPDRDRIHFLYDAGAGCIVVGIFTEHCYLP